MKLTSLLACATATITVLFVAAATSSGQLPQQGLNPESFYGKDSQQGVYVRDSAVALEKFALAQRMERLKEWNKSADVYQEILEKYPDRVVPSQIDKDNNIYQYTSVAMAVQEKLARWPDDGLNAYRARYENTAATMLEQAGPEGFEQLNRIYSLYFVTDSAKKAAIRLIDLYLEAGEFPAAAWLGDRLLAWHPNVFVERPMLIYRTALAYHLSGNEAQASARLKELQEKHADATGKIRGADAVLAQSLESELKTAPPIAQKLAADSWPIFGGDVSRGRVSPATGRPGAKIWDRELSTPTWKGLNAQQRREQERDEQSARAAGLMLGVMPVVDHGELFFQDGARIYAVSLDSGVPLPGWAETYPGQRGGVYAINTWAMPRNAQLTVTITNNEVLAVMGQPDRVAITQGLAPAGERETRLVCLDRQSGKEKWTVFPRRLADDAAHLRSLELSGSPLVVGDNVYVMGRGGKGNQFEDCYVLCFALSDGKYRWSCYIASANTTNQMFGDAGALIDNVSHLAYASGRLYALTNLGALAAIDAYSGTIQWLNIYPRDIINDPNQGAIPLRGRFGRGGAEPQVAGKPWAFNPVIVQDGRVFILASDAKHLLVYDSGTGVEVKRIDLSHLANPDTLLGVVGNRLVVAGEKKVLCVNWVAYDAAKFNPRDSKYMFWPQELPCPIRGRGFVTADTVFIPTEDRLVLIGLNSGKVEDTYPKYPVSQWDDNEGPGNLLVTQDHVIIAGSKRVDVYTDINAARQKLDLEVAAAPTEPDPRLRYAEIMFVSGQHATALQKLDEAIQLLGGTGAMRPGDQRDRVFNDSLTFAQKLGKEDRPESIDLATKLFDRAAAAANSASQQVNYRVSRARFAHRMREFGPECRMYQEILGDKEMRVVALATDDSPGPQQAGAIAEKAISDLIKDVGPKVYEPFEQIATTALEAAKRQNDPAQYLAVAQTYPNSKVAATAMLAAADAYEAASDSRAATQVLRQIYFKYPESPDKARVIEAMVRNYLRMPNRMDVAIARLAQGAKQFGNNKLSQPLMMPDGKLLEAATFAEALSALRRYHGQAVSRTLPDVKIAFSTDKSGKKHPEPFVPETPDSVIPDVTAIVPPLRDFGRHDRIVAWTAAQKLAVFEVGKTKPSAVSDALTEQARGVAWLGSSSLIAWSGREIAHLQAESANTAWRVELKALPAVEVVGGGGEIDEVADVDPPDDGIIVRRGRNNIRIDRRFLIENGAVRQIVIPGGAIVQPQIAVAAGAEEQILDARPIGDRVIVSTSTGRLFAIEIADGRTAWQTRLTNRPLDRFLANEDFIVARLTDDVNVQLVTIDTFAGQILSRRNFSVANGQIPLNMALAADGMLVFLLPDRLCGKDLYEPDTKLNFDHALPADGTGNPAFVGAAQPDQLLVTEGRILALSDSGMFVRVHSAESGREAAKPLSTGSSNWNVSLRSVGPMLYAIGPRKAMAYNLDTPGPADIGARDADEKASIRDAWVAKDHLVLLDSLTGANPVPERITTFRLLAFSRAAAASGESGKLDQDPIITNPAGILQWQAVDGGFYYLTGDAKLHLLKGARE